MVVSLAEKTTRIPHIELNAELSRFRYNACATDLDGCKRLEPVIEVANILDRCLVSLLLPMLCYIKPHSEEGS